MNGVLARWNEMEPEKAAEEILPCCGSKAWARAMARQRPIFDKGDLLRASDAACAQLQESDWLEAFRSHPRIGESQSPATANVRSATWSGEEQRNVSAADDEIKRTLAAGNREYEERFRRIFIVCATGKTPLELLANLQRRLRNDEKTELREAAEQQRLITQIRLRKWLQA